MKSTFPDLPILAELGEDLEGAWLEAETVRRPVARRRRARPSLVVAIVLLVMALAAAALAASGLLDGGNPLHPPRGTSRDPHSGLGVTRGGAQLLKLAVPDPAGGPAWGVRYVTTSRGLGCLQAGRLVDGRIGVLGQDGAFRNDGRFHPLARNYLGGIAAPFPCGTLDSRGHAFASVAMNGVPASGLLQPSATQPGCVAHRDHGPIGKRKHQIPRCPRKDWRQVYYGMAGPEALAVTYVTASGRLRTIPTVGEQGAYLIVRRAPLQKGGLATYSLVDGAGAGPIVSIRYRNGTVCRRTVDGRDPIQTCPHVGEVPVARRALTRADVAAPVTVRIEKGRRGATLEVSFTPRVAVKDASATYAISVRLPGRAAGVNCGATIGGSLYSDVKAGVPRTFRIPTEGCRGRFTGTVSYRYGQNSAGPPGMTGGALTVGTFSVYVKLR